MALIICEECGKEISDQANNCPHCGYPVFIVKPPTEKPKTMPIKPVESNTSSPCPKCGTTNQGNARFCSNCGYDFSLKPNPNSTTTKHHAPPKIKKKDSALSIVAAILGFFTVTSVIGLVVAIIDFCKRDDTKRHLGSWFAVVMFVLSAILVYPNFFSTPQNTKYDPKMSKEDFMASCQEIDYETLARNPEQYTGQPIVVTIQVEQIVQQGIFTKWEFYRVFTNDDFGMWTGDEYIMFDSRADDTTKILQGDVLKVYAVADGTTTVRRALTDTDEDVPAIKAVYIEILQPEDMFADFDSSSDTATQSIDNTDEELDEIEEFGNINVDEGLFDVTITFPKSYFEGMTEDEIINSANESGLYKDVRVKDDGSVTYTMTKENHRKLLDETTIELNSLLEQMVGSEEYPNFTDIEANEDFTEFTITTKSTELDITESFSVMAFYMYGGMYGIISGNQPDNIVVNFINADTGEIISTSQSKDMGE